MRSLRNKKKKVRKSRKQRLSEKYSKRFLRLFTRHPSHDCIKKKTGKGILCDDIAIIRLGSTTKSCKKIQLNSIESIKNSSNKILMKQCFKDAGVKTSKHWRTPEEVRTDIEGEVVSFPILAKLVFGSRGNGMKKFDNIDEFEEFVASRRYTERSGSYYFEDYANYVKEYRIHVSMLGNCFYTCRKMLKSDTPEGQRWFRNDSNSVWYVESNEKFDKPTTWDAIVADCVKGLKSVGLDVGGFDVRVNKKGEWTVIECNSACSFAEGTEAAYREILPKLVAAKKKELNL